MASMFAHTVALGLISSPPPQCWWHSQRRETAPRSVAASNPGCRSCYGRCGRGSAGCLVARSGALDQGIATDRLRSSCAVGVFVAAQARGAPRIVLPARCSRCGYRLRRGAVFVLGGLGGMGLCMAGPGVIPRLAHLMPCALMAGWYGVAQRLVAREAVALVAALVALFLVAAHPTSTARYGWASGSSFALIIASLHWLRRSKRPAQRGCQCHSPRCSPWSSSAPPLPPPSACTWSAKRPRWRGAEGRTRAAHPLWPEVAERVEKRPLTGYGSRPPACCACFAARRLRRSAALARPQPVSGRRDPGRHFPAWRCCSRCSPRPCARAWRLGAPARTCRSPAASRSRPWSPECWRAT